MATLFIAVWGGASLTLVGEPLQEITVSIGASSTQSSAISGPATPKQRQVRLYADADCFVHWADNPTALTDGTAGRPLGADNPEVFNIDSGKLIAVIERV